LVFLLLYPTPYRLLKRSLQMVSRRKDAGAGQRARPDRPSGEARLSRSLDDRGYQPGDAAHDHCGRRRDEYPAKRKRKIPLRMAVQLWPVLQPHDKREPPGLATRVSSYEAR